MIRSVIGFTILMIFISTVATDAAATAETAAGVPDLHSPAATSRLPGIIDRVPEIIPGVQVGPVKLGMSGYDAAGAALAFEQATGCQVDLLIVADRVAAIGTRFGGCLEVSLPQGTRASVARTGAVPIPMGAWMDGPASAFIRVFGKPLEVPLKANRVALIWPEGLVAHVGGILDGDGNVTYLAVVTPGSTVVPAIGYLRISLSSGFEE